ncbi:MAG: hypothetical protein PHS79_04930 [Patescibacteria group bacterium]|nr:hypothetical protein [Patescibacteria group bacterium]
MSKKISPGGDHMSDASQQPAQQMIQASKNQRPADDTSGGLSANPRMKLAVNKIVHTPETPADYEKRVKLDRELRSIKGDQDIK